MIEPAENLMSFTRSNDASEKKITSLIGPLSVAIFMLESVNRHTKADSMGTLYDWPAGCGDIHVRKCEQTHGSRLDVYTV